MDDPKLWAAVADDLRWSIRHLAPHLDQHRVRRVVNRLATTAAGIESLAGDNSQWPLIEDPNQSRNFQSGVEGWRSEPPHFSDKMEKRPKKKDHRTESRGLGEEAFTAADIRAARGQ